MKANPDSPIQDCLPVREATQDRSANPAHQPQLLTAEQAAAQLGVNLSTLNRWARQGRVTYIQVGSVRRYDPVVLRPPVPAAAPHRPDRRDEKLWTAADVAARLGVSAQLVVRFARQGDFGSSRTRGGRLRFSRGEIERFAAAQVIDPADAVALTRASVALGISARTLKRWGTAGIVELHRGLAGAEVVHRGDLERLVVERGVRSAARDPDSLTTHDVAVLLGRSAEWVRQRAQAGVIPSWRPPGGHRRFRLSDLPVAPEPTQGAAPDDDGQEPSGTGGGGGDQ